MNNERPSAEKLIELRRRAGDIQLVFAELDAVTRELNDWKKKADGNCDGCGKPFDGDAYCVRCYDTVMREKEEVEKKLGIGLSGMNLITDRERGSR